MRTGYLLLELARQKMIIDEDLPPSFLTIAVPAA